MLGNKYRQLFVFLFIIPFPVLMEETGKVSENFEFAKSSASNLTVPFASLKTPDGSLLLNSILNPSLILYSCAGGAINVAEVKRITPANPA